MNMQLTKEWAEKEMPVLITEPFAGSAPQKQIVLPAPIDALQLLESDLPKPPELVCGILHKGSKMVIGGGSKSFKTWTLIDLAVSVATGAKWWGFPTNKGRVLYMNFEIQDPFFQRRLGEVLVAKDCKLDGKGQLLYWGLRGKAANLRVLMPGIIEMIKDDGYSLIIFDPIYKGLGDGDENKAGDIASLLNEIEALAVETGAAVAFGHHFSKGNQSKKDSIDRIGGSGVFARDPDTILTMTQHEQDDAFTVDPVLRNFPPVEPFVVRREHPLMVRDASLNAKDLKRASAPQEKYSDDDILKPLERGGMTTTEWQSDLRLGIGISASGFHDRRRKLEEKGLIRRDKKKWIKVSK
jgi:AAA domain-containing protein